MIQFFGVGEVVFPAKVVTEIDIEISDPGIEITVAEYEVEITIECNDG